MTGWPYTLGIGDADFGPWINITFRSDYVIFGTTSGRVDAFAVP